MEEINLENLKMPDKLSDICKNTITVNGDGIVLCKAYIYQNYYPQQGRKIIASLPKIYIYDASLTTISIQFDKISKSGDSQTNIIDFTPIRKGSLIGAKGFYTAKNSFVRNENETLDLSFSHSNGFWIPYQYQEGDLILVGHKSELEEMLLHSFSNFPTGEDDLRDEDGKTCFYGDYDIQLQENDKKQITSTILKLL